MTALSRVLTAELDVAEALVGWLVASGVRQAFGVSGGGVAALWSAFARPGAPRLIHTQHESGALFAATELSLATGELVVALVTTGPGLANALNGLIAARQEGARVLLLSGLTPSARRGRGATQESCGEGPLGDWLRPGPVLHLGAAVESAAQLQALLHRVAWGAAGEGGFVAHLGLPTDLLLQPCPPLLAAPARRPAPLADPGTLDRLASALTRGQLLALVGRAAAPAREALRALCDRAPLRVVAAPHGKGVLPEDHPACLGVAGFAGAERTLDALRERPFEILLLLGAGLSEAESGWSEALRPREAVVIAGGGGELISAFPELEQVYLDTGPESLLAGLLARLGERTTPPPEPSPRLPSRPLPSQASPPLRAAGPVRPSALLDAVQRVVVEQSDATLLAESGNAFAWAIHRLVLPEPRLRVSVGWGSMGHVSMGAIGVAAAGRRAVALVGDGSMLMGHEILTAARHRLDVVWIVLNDQGYGMCRHGMTGQGFRTHDLDQPWVDFAALARSLGAAGLSVRAEGELEPVLASALALRGPVVVDVAVDPAEAPPIGRRLRALTFHAPVGS